MSTVPVSNTDSLRRNERVAGIDVARAFAMFGMLVTHYVLSRNTIVLSDIPIRFAGRAMPLFVILGGLGVTLMTKRSAVPDRALLFRGALLFTLGMALTHYSERIAVILPAYGLLFAAAIGFRRLRSWQLLPIAAVAVAVGGYTYQEFAAPERLLTVSRLLSSTRGIESLLVGGPYPFFPTAGFFIVGMWLGRLDLRSHDVAVKITRAGIGVWLGTAVASGLAEALLERTTTPNRSGFAWITLTNTTGHSQMTAWVLSAIGTSLIVLGLSLRVAWRWPRALQPFAVCGTMALTFYTVQIVLSLWIGESSIITEWLITLTIFIAFTGFALAWNHVFGAGPLEQALRVGSSKKHPRSTAT